MSLLTAREEETTQSYLILTVGSASLSNETDGQKERLATIVSNDDGGQPPLTVAGFCQKHIIAPYRSSYRPCLLVLQRWQALEALTHDCRDSSSSHHGEYLSIRNRDTSREFLKPIRGECLLT